MPPAKLKVQLGMKFNALTVVGPAPRGKLGHPQWYCVCVCGKRVTRRQSQLTGLTTESCGCLGRNRQVKRQTKHGMFGTPEYRAWNGMKARCQNPRNRQFKHYGGRGITVCDHWQVFENFYADIGLRPSAHHSIDRKNNDLGYSPDNCRWATKTEQGRNRRTNTLITFADRTLTLAGWCELLGVNYDIVCGRLFAGVGFVDAVTLPKNFYKHKKYERTCKDCGAAFARGHSAQYCKECVKRRAVESKARSRERNVTGTLRSQDTKIY